MEEGFKASVHVIDGELYLGSQEHFYMETSCSLADYKSDDGEIHVYSSTQYPAGIQVI